MIESHSQALSEPPFIVFYLASMLAVLSYLDSGEIKHLIWTAVAVSAAVLTRYAGIFLLIGIIVVIAFSWRSLNQHVVSYTSASVALFIAVLPLCAWIVHNLVVSGSAVGWRRLALHPPTLLKLRDLVGTISLRFAPQTLPSYLRLSILLCAAIAVLSTVISAHRVRYRANNRLVRQPLLLAEISIFVNILYLVMLILTVSLLDADTPLDERLLLPIYQTTTLIVSAAVILRRELFGRRSIIYGILVGGSLLIVVSNSARFVQTVQRIRANGVGFQQGDWIDNVSMTYVRNLAQGTAVYSDNPNLLYYATGRQTFGLPEKFDGITMVANPEFEAK